MNSRALIAVTTIMVCTVIGSGCANSSARYQPIIDGHKSQSYQSDLASCQGLAQQRKFSNGDVKSEALAGAVIGTIAGAFEDGSEGAIGGALAGSALGAGTRAWETREERKQIVINCLKQRGHPVVG